MQEAQTNSVTSSNTKTTNTISSENNPFDYSYNTNYHQVEESTVETQQDAHNTTSGSHSPTTPSKFFATFASQQTNYVPPVLSPVEQSTNPTVEPPSNTQETLEFDDAYTWQVCFDKINFHSFYKLY